MMPFAASLKNLPDAPTNGSPLFTSSDPGFCPIAMIRLGFILENTLEKHFGSIS
jgi:hypothetical protein